MVTFYQKQNLKKDSKSVIFPYLNLLRFIAAMIVVMHHFAIQVPPFDDGVLNQWIGNGNFMVNLFFVLSGFVLYHRYQNANLKGIKEIKAFYLKRAKRLLPLYFLGLTVSLCYYLYVIESIDWIRVVLAFTGLQSFDLWSFPVINIPSWSLSVEYFLYLLFPFVLMMLPKTKPKFIIVLSLIFWGLTETLFHFIHAKYPSLHIDFIPFFSLASFVLGIASYQILETLKSKKQLTRLSLSCFMTLTTIIVLYQPYFYKNYSGLLAPLFSVLIVSLGAISGNANKLSWMNKLGDLSYAIYILHWPTYEIYGLVLEYFEVPSRHTINVFLSYLLLVIIVSTIANFLQGLLMKKTSRQLPL